MAASERGRRRDLPDGGVASDAEAGEAAEDGAEGASWWADVIEEGSGSDADVRPLWPIGPPRVARQAQTDPVAVTPHPEHGAALAALARPRCLNCGRVVQPGSRCGFCDSGPRCDDCHVVHQWA